MEPFRDETLSSLKNLRKAGVPVDFRVYEVCDHGFDIISSRAKLSEEAAAFFLEGFRYGVDHYPASKN